MCAIFGINFMNGCNIGNKELVKQLLEKLLIVSSPRGRRATGVAFISNKEVTVVKDNVEADEFIDLKEYNEACKKYINPAKEISRDRTISIIGHCRFPTKGSPKIRDNNHPLVAGNIIGIHNGVIFNDDALFNRLNLPRKGQVDSEVIFQLLNFYIHGRSHNAIKAIQISSIMLSGDFACAFIDATNPYMLWLFKDLNPLYVEHFVDDGLIIFASNPEYIRIAVKNTILGTSTSIGLEQDKGMGINLYTNNQYTFELENWRSESYGK